jgi:hypothetical protein
MTPTVAVTVSVVPVVGAVQSPDVEIVPEAADHVTAGWLASGKEN